VQGLIKIEECHLGRFTCEEYKFSKFLAEIEINSADLHLLLIVIIIAVIIAVIIAIICRSCTEYVAQFWKEF